jgi:urease accessory protein
MPQENAGGFGGLGGPSQSTAPPILSVLLSGSWDIASAVDSVVIGFDRRFRRRLLLRTESGREVLLDLPQAVRLRQDDGLVLPDGGIVRVCAAAEALLEISAVDSALLLRISWHLGNRHLPVQFLGGCLRIRADHVIAEMVQGLGGLVSSVSAPFDPEAGAYAVGGGHHHHRDDEDDGHHHHHE